MKMKMWLLALGAVQQATALSATLNPQSVKKLQAPSAAVAVSPADLAQPQLYIGNIGSGATAPELRRALSPLGVVKVDIPTDDTGRARGFALATLREGLRADAAVLGSRVVVAGRALRLERNTRPSRRHVELNGRIGSLRSAEEVLKLFGEHGGSMNEVNLATTIRALAGFARADDPRLLDLLKAVERRADEFEPRGLANVMWSLAKMGLSKTPAFDALALSALERIEGFSAQSLANTAWALSKTNHPALLRSIARAAVPQMGLFKPQELANLVWAFSTQKMIDDFGFYDAVTKHARPREMKPQEVSNLAWAFASTNRSPKILFDEICASRDLSRFTSQNLANLVWALAPRTEDKIGSRTNEFFSEVAAELAGRELLPQDRSMVAWAFTRARLEPPPVVWRGAVDSTWKPQALANTAWAFAKATHGQAGFMDAVAAQALVQIHEFNSKDLACLSWAFAESRDRKHASLYAAIAQRAVEIIELGPREMAVLSSALSRLLQDGEAFFGAMATRALPRLPDFSPHELTTLARAFAFSVSTDQAKMSSSFFLEALASEAVNNRDINDFTPRELCGLAWALATLNVSAPRLFQAIETELFLKSDSKMASLDSTTLANTAWAYATAGLAAPVLFQSIAVTALARFGEFDGPALASTLWSLATAGAAARAMLFSSLKPNFFEDNGDMSTRELAQLHQLQLFLDDGAAVGSRLRAATAESEPKAPAAALAEVSKALGPAYVSHVTDCGLPIQLAKISAKVGVQVNGPAHYLHDRSTLNGRTLFKLRLLRKGGWKIAEIPHSEWVTLKTSRSQREYLDEKLTKLNAAPSTAEKGRR